MATDYDNPTGISPLLPTPGIPGITLPDDFTLEAADRGMVPGPVAPKPKKPPFVQQSPVRFPSRDPTVYGEGISRLVGAFSGPGFNLIFRPHTDKSGDEDKDPDGIKPKLSVPLGGLQNDLLELNLTHEIWTFPRADLGEIPNRVAAAGKDAILFGIPYTQIVRDVTDAGTGTRVPVDRLGKCNVEKKKALVSDIHFEPGLLIHVEHSSPVSDEATITRMASIPHGTTINAQGAKAVKLVGAPDIPLFSETASQPFLVNGGGPIPFTDDQFNLDKKDATRLPQNMTDFLKTESITKKMTQDPNELLRIHNVGKNFSQFVRFTVSTTPSQPLDKQACPHLAAQAAMQSALDAFDTQNKVPAPPAPAPPANQDAKTKAAQEAATKAIAAARKAIADAMVLCSEPVPTKGQKPTAAASGTSNIAFLDGTLTQGPNARTGRVTSTFWISTVLYTLTLPKDFTPTLDNKGNVLMKDGKPVNSLPPFEPTEKSEVNASSGRRKFAAEDDGTFPTFVFPADRFVAKGRYQVSATQVQYSQTVNLIFNGLVWPHVSVATLVPIRPVVVNFATKVS
ncbi:hypothetical protein EG327_010837 [Venturia inaequalis]|uniref:Uncharacterized protein n=1 Tax=Venturia inaequalis TaxID=5025 RepID=A0A8H3VPY4_VENIN|nr:hypothetical protein EG327_010837 [Venturia inaequalis]